MSSLMIPIKKEWFDMIVAGEKKEEYREIKPYWVRRLVGNWHQWRTLEGHYRHELLMRHNADRIIFKNGYQKNARTATVEWKSLRVDTPVPKWCPSDTDYTKNVFVIELGEIIETNFQ